DLAAALHQNCVNNVEGLMLEAAVAQQLQEWALGGLTLIPQRIVHIAALFVLYRQSRRSTQVGLVGEHDEKFRLLTVRRMFHDPGRNLGRAHRLLRRATLTASTRGPERPQRCDGSRYDEQ